MIFQTLIIHYANFGTPNKPSFYCILLHEYTMQFCIKMAAARPIAAAVVPSASTHSVAFQQGVFLEKLILFHSLQNSSFL